MTIERILRGVAGAFVLISIALAWVGGQVDLARPTWIWFTAFVGLNLLQSGFTNWCPMMSILKKCGVAARAPAPASRGGG